MTIGFSDSRLGERWVGCDNSLGVRRLFPSITSATFDSAYLDLVEVQEFLMPAFIAYLDSCHRVKFDLVPN